MSEESTQNLPKHETQPTIETLLKEMRAGFKGINDRLDEIETRLDKTQALDVRGDLRELKKTLKEQLNLSV